MQTVTGPATARGSNVWRFIAISAERMNFRSKCLDYENSFGCWIIIFRTSVLGKVKTQLNTLALFGEILGGEITLNPFGQIVHFQWLKTADIRQGIRLDEFIIMQNHFHGIV